MANDVGSTNADGSGSRQTGEENGWYEKCNLQLVLSRVKVHADVVEGVLDKEDVNVRQLVESSVSLARLCKKISTKDVLKVNHVGHARDAGHFVITEPYEKFSDWSKNNSPIDDSGEWNYETFIRPFRCLLENVLCILDAKGDFELHKWNIVVVRREGKSELKVGLNQLNWVPKPRTKDIINSFSDLCTIIEGWVSAYAPDKSCRGLYSLLEDLRGLEHSAFVRDKNVHHLRFVLMHPLFIPDAMKGELFELAFKADWVKRMVVGPVISGKDRFDNALVNALNQMEQRCGITPHLGPQISLDTVWFDSGLSNTSFSKWFEVVLKGNGNSRKLKFHSMIRSLRNFYAHLDENVVPPDSIASCADQVNIFCPGFWHALHHVVLTSMYLNEFMDGEWFPSMEGWSKKD